jgi:hypothetical protein
MAQNEDRDQIIVPGSSHVDSDRISGCVTRFCTMVKSEYLFFASPQQKSKVLQAEKTWETIIHKSIRKAPFLKSQCILLFLAIK